MRDRRMGKSVLLPFSVGCLSRSSVAVGESQPKRAAQAQPPPATSSGGKRPSGMRKLVKCLKGFFAVHEEEEGEEEEEMEMVIGFPTDVKHVAHIGWDGRSSMSNMEMKSWVKGPPEPLSLNSSSLSLKQFEAAMATLAAGVPPPRGPLVGA